MDIFVSLQIEDVDAKFVGLDKLREADWKQPEPEVKKVIKVRDVFFVNYLHDELLGGNIFWHLL